MEKELIIFGLMAIGYVIGFIAGKGKLAKFLGLDNHE